MIRSLVAFLLAMSGAAIVAQEHRPVFRTARDTVTVSVSVKRGNNPVTGLTPGDFRLFDNDVAQTVDALTLEAVPVDVTLFLDTSGSTVGSLDDMRDAVAKISAILRPDDRMRVITIGVAVEQHDGWRRAGEIVDLRLRPVQGISLICDAILTSLLHRVPPGRRHLVIALTDGHEAGSIVGAKTVAAGAARTEAVLHWIPMGGGYVLRDGATAWRDRHPGADTLWLSEAVRATGGDRHREGFWRANPVAAFTKIFEDFRQSYVLYYSPEGVTKDGWHRLRVEVPGGKYAVRARSGYFGK